MNSLFHSDAELPLVIWSLFAQSYCYFMKLQPIINRLRFRDFSFFSYLREIFPPGGLNTPYFLTWETKRIGYCGVQLAFQNQFHFTLIVSNGRVKLQVGNRSCIKIVQFGKLRKCTEWPKKYLGPDAYFTVSNAKMFNSIYASKLKVYLVCFCVTGQFSNCTELPQISS